MEIEESAVLSPMIESKDEVLHEELDITSKSLGLFKVEVYRSPDGIFLGGICIRPELVNSNRVIEFNNVLKFDLLDKLIFVKVKEGNTVYPKIKIAHLQLSPNGRQITHMERKILDKDLSFGNLKVIDRNKFCSIIMDIIRFIQQGNIP